ncbi:MAG: ASKHA domain-containing protein [Clostridium sp.]|nr:ASKHA domain-containing protein [Acetatifactor muris]MCM1526822.1 ASKHA domain-containing protein [Bacteroides sp.]MCM1562977.1 ASKHA domain-containing protein [Clostridium sp.]
MSDQDWKGSRCQICTGCGHCLGADAGKTMAGNTGAVRDFGNSRGTGGGLRIVTAYEAPEDAAAGPFPERLRLVTADIGTTTIAMQLFDGGGHIETDYACVNPQVRFGADVLSRIRAARDPASAGAMRDEVRGAVAEGLKEFRSCLGQGETMRMVLAGNTTMIYLFMGYDPEELGRAPFAATHLGAVRTKIEGVPCVIFPGFSAFVGGDIMAGVYACGMRESGELTLLIDLGTNGEMVLGDARRGIACATAAGPAFEGGAGRGVWGADMVHLLACLRREGIVDETGLLADPYFDEGITIGDVRVTQEAVRAIQLAKGAVGAGIRILMKEYGIEEDWNAIGRVVLAGGFGYYLDPEDAAEIGLLPAQLVARTRAGGNTALAGAARLGRRLLAGETGGREDPAQGAGGMMGEILEGLDTRGMEIVNLAAHPDFERLYIEHMDLR